jgi:Protein of unknown function (DUF4232)
VRTRGLFTLVVVLAGSGVLSAAGCARSASGAPGKAVWAQPSVSAPVLEAPAPPASSASSRPPSAPNTRLPASGSRAPAPTRPPAGGTNGWPPYCHLTDIRFSTGSGTGAGSLVSGEVLMTNVSGHTCVFGTYPILRWRDARGAVVPLTVNHVRGPVPPSLPFVIQPGSTAFAGLYWDRYTSLNSTETCPPYPTTLDVWLPPTVEDPHPEQGTPAHAAWVTGDNASVCRGTVQLQPIDRLP